MGILSRVIDDLIPPNSPHKQIFELWSKAQVTFNCGNLDEWSRQVREGKMPDFGFNRTFLSLKVPLCWELRRPEAVLGRLYHRTREGAWFVCAFEPAAGFKNIVESFRYDFRNVSGETPD